MGHQPRLSGGPNGQGHILIAQKISSFLNAGFREFRVYNILAEETAGNRGQERVKKLTRRTEVHCVDCGHEQRRAGCSTTSGD